MEKELVPIIKDLLSIPSVADNVVALRDAVDYVATYVEAHSNVTIERFERGGKPSFLAYKGDQRPKRFDVILSAHLDVVPGESDQFEPVVKGGRLYGRGAFDMKAAAIAETAVFCELVDRVSFALGLQIVSDEEVGGYNGVLYQIEQGVRAQLVITGEHTLAPGVIYTEQRGLAWVEVMFSGTTAHAGYPWKGDNALTRATTFVQNVLAVYPVPKEEIWGTTVNIASIETTNTTHNVIPDNARVKMDFRFTPSDRTFDTIETITTFIQSIDPTAEVTAIPVFDPASTVRRSNPYLRALQDALEEQRGEPVVFESRYAGGDARHYAAVGDDAVEFGLTGGSMHGSKEYVDISSLSPYMHILRSFLEKVSIRTRDTYI